MHLADERAAGEVAVHHHLENIVVQVVLGKIPKIVIGFIKKIQLVQALHPAHFDLHVQVLRVAFFAKPAYGIFQLIRADGKGIGHDGPIGRVAVDSWNLIGRELKDLVFHIWAFQPRTKGHGAEPDEKRIHGRPFCKSLGDTDRGGPICAVLKSEDS